MILNSNNEISELCYLSNYRHSDTCLLRMSLTSNKIVRSVPNYRTREVSTYRTIWLWLYVKACQIVFYLTKAVCSKVSNGFFLETFVFALLHVAKSQMVFLFLITLALTMRLMASPTLWSLVLLGDRSQLGPRLLILRIHYSYLIRLSDRFHITIIP